LNDEVGIDRVGEKEAVMYDALAVGVKSSHRVPDCPPYDVGFGVFDMGDEKL
jgi:hypothetical protein